MSRNHEGNHTIQVTVRLFASLREMAGTGQCVLDVPDGATLEQAIDRLVERFPALDGHQASWHFAVNQEHAEPGEILKDGDSVAVFPYVAGG
jgi:molybdopterin converting factor subunit 1